MGCYYKLLRIISASMAEWLGVTQGTFEVTLFFSKRLILSTRKCPGQRKNVRHQTQKMASVVNIQEN
jgi:hypothetical protein